MKKGQAPVLIVLPFVVFLGSCARHSAPPPLGALVLHSSAEKLSLAPGVPLLFPPEGVDRVQYATATFAPDLAFDIYYPPDSDRSHPLPVTVLANGLDDDEIRRVDNAALKDLAMLVSWGRAFAASGFAAVTYDSREQPLRRGEAPKAPASTLLLLAFLERHAAELGIDGTKIGFYSMGETGIGLQRVLSGASAALRRNFRCATFNYAALDKDILPATKLPILLVRPGHADQGILFGIDDWAGALRGKAIPVEVWGVPTGGFNFDYMVNNDDTRAAISKILEFMKHGLLDSGSGDAAAPPKK